MGILAQGLYKDSEWSAGQLVNHIENQKSRGLF